MKSYQYISLHIIGCLALLIIFMLSQSKQVNANTSLSASPLIQTLSLTNASQSANLALSNNSNHKIIFSLNILPFKQSSSSSDRPILGSKKVILSSPFLKNITVSINNQAVQSFALAAHSSQILQVHIPPQIKQQKPTDYYFSLILSTRNAADTVNNTAKKEIDAYINQNLAIGTLFLLSPTISLLPPLMPPSLVKLTQPEYVYGSAIRGNIILRNPNPTYQNISISIIQNNILGAIIKTTSMPESFILAKNTRQFSYALDTQGYVGIENIVLSIKDLHSGKSITLTRSVILLPTKVGILISILVFGILYIIYKIKKRLIQM